MIRVFLIAIVALLVVLAVGVVVLGSFPPHLRRQPVEHVLPSDRLPAH